jgi:DnaJ-class molecular chaperone
VQYEGIGPGGSDLVVQFKVTPDRKWQRDGLNLTQEVRIDIWNLILGRRSYYRHTDWKNTQHTSAC